MRRPRERVSLPAPGLTVAERRGGEAVDGHLDEPLDARVLQDVTLARLGLEDHVEGERLELVHLLLLDLRRGKKKVIYVTRILETWTLK